VPVALRALVLAALIAALVVIPGPPPLLGDGVEYAATLMAWINHASPEIRSVDLATVPSPFVPLGYDRIHPAMLVTTASGAHYATHFWLYSLLCAPVALLLRGAGGDALTAFPISNAVLFAGLITAACWSSRLSSRDRAMIALAAASPVVLYLPFAHPEVFTWACVLLSLLAINRSRYALAALLAACGAVQNPPVTSLAVFCVVLAAWERGWRGAVLPAAAALLCFAPALFYFLAVGQAAPLFVPGFVDWRLASPARLWSMLTDLSQGLLPYVPGLVLLAAARLRHARSVRHWGVLGVLLLCIASAAISENWNSALAGLMRYAVWVIPILAWLATEPGPGARWGIVMPAIALNGVLLLLPVPETNAHSRLASYALANWPSVYRPDPEIFGERSLQLDWVWRERLPIGFTRRDGSISLILNDAAALTDISRVFAVDPAHLSFETAAYAGRTGLVYLAPPPGAVRSLCTADPASQRAALRGIRLHARWPDEVTARRAVVPVEITNDSDTPVCNLGAGGHGAFNLAFRIGSGTETPVVGTEQTRGPQILPPRTTVQQVMTVVLPPQDGRYLVELLPVIHGVGWGEPDARLIVDVHTDGGDYRASGPDHLPATGAERMGSGNRQVDEARLRNPR
jgi:hypothetical protein